MKGYVFSFLFIGLGCGGVFDVVCGGCDFV